MESKEEKNNFCIKMFGKRCADLTKEERKEFWKLQKRLSRTGKITAHVKATKGMTEEETKEWYRADSRKRYRENKSSTSRITSCGDADNSKENKAWTWTLSYKLFGKKMKDLNVEEKKIYARERAKLYRRKKMGETK